MAEDYYGRCAMCRYLNLYDRDSGFLGLDKYFCTRRNQYVPWGDKQCGYFSQAPGSADDRIELVEKARRGQLK